jgi:hypothetical protein
MYYLNQNISESKANLEVTALEILQDRINFILSPLKFIFTPIKLLANFYEAIINEGKQSVINKKLNQQQLVDLALNQEARTIEMEAIRAIQLQQLHEQSKAPELTPRQVINRRNASAPRKSRNNA